MTCFIRPTKPEDIHYYTDVKQGKEANTHNLEAEIVSLENLL